ncbi:L-threonine 3-dehydrogenase, partial [Clarias magur]
MTDNIREAPAATTVDDSPDYKGELCGGDGDIICYICKNCFCGLDKVPLDAYQKSLLAFKSSRSNLKLSAKKRTSVRACSQPRTPGRVLRTGQHYTGMGIDQATGFHK